MARLLPAHGAAERRAPLPPIARAPDVKDVLHLFETHWFGIEEHTAELFLGEEDVPRRPTVPRGLPRGAASDDGDNGSSSLPGSLHFDGSSPILQIINSQPEEGINYQPRSFLRRLTSLMSPLESKAATPRAKDADDVQPGLGTWAERQIMFTPRQGDEGTSCSTPDSSNGNAALPSEQFENGPSPNNDAAMVDGNGSPLASSLSARRYSADMNDAWRWRFTRKWQMEQARPQNEVTPTKDVDDDEDMTALDYMALAAGGMNLQFARTTSLDNSASFDGGLSQSLSVLLADDASLPRDGNLRSETSGGMEGTPQATQRIVRAMKKAQELMACQEEIERQVEARWEGSQEPWAAQRIPAVAIDSWGTFSFILARVLDKEGGRQKLLVRGRNRSTEQQAAKALEKEVALEASKQKLPRPRVEILGSGQMNWPAERDRCLQISGETLHIVLEGRLKTKEDVGRVAGALTQTGLTAQHTVVLVKA